MEIWRYIEGYEGLYQVSNEGRVKSIKKFINSGIHTTENILKERITPNGYNQICLTLGGKHLYYYAHRLVAENFIPNPDNKPEVDHINGNKLDNRVENLRWTTKSENMSNPVTTEKLSEIKTGKHISPNTEFKKGRIPWNKGKKYKIKKEEEN